MVLFFPSHGFNAPHLLQIWTTVEPTHPVWMVAHAATLALINTNVPALRATQARTVKSVSVGGSRCSTRLGKSQFLVLIMKSGLGTKIQTCLFMMKHEQLVSLNISLLLTVRFLVWLWLKTVSVGTSIAGRRISCWPVAAWFEVLGSAVPQQEWWCV